jgi:hypothetical protein
VRGCATRSGPAPSGGDVHATRELALKRWGAVPSSSERLKNIVNKLHPTTSDTSEEFGGLQWHSHERLDFALQWVLPSTWQVQQRAKENLVSIQCAPPRPERSVAEAEGFDPAAAPTVHGMSLTAFAYHQRLADANADALMSSFLRQFSRSVGNSLVVLGTSDPRKAVVGNEPHLARCRILQESCGGAVAEIKFTPPQCATIPARGLCRAFFSHSLKAHYVAVLAVPEAEFELVEDLVRFGMTNVLEISRGDAG